MWTGQSYILWEILMYKQIHSFEEDSLLTDIPSPMRMETLLIPTTVAYCAQWPSPPTDWKGFSKDLDISKDSPTATGTIVQKNHERIHGIILGHVQLSEVGGLVVINKLFNGEKDVVQNSSFCLGSWET